MKIKAGDLKHGQRFKMSDGSGECVASGIVDKYENTVFLGYCGQYRLVGIDHEVELIEPTDATGNCAIAGAGGGHASGPYFAEQEKAAEDIFPPKPWLDPGEGWRLLEGDEIVQKGDSVYDSFLGQWSERHAPLSTSVGVLLGYWWIKAVRRRVEPEFIDLQPGMQITIPIESTDLSRILDALDGDNPDQKRLAEVGLSLVAMVLRKNTDYQNSAWQVPRFAKHLDARTAILVRMGDKVARLERILANDAQVTDEPVEATVGDLAGYAIVLMAAPKETNQ